MRTEVKALTARLGVKIDPDRLAEGLSIADQQILEMPGNLPGRQGFDHGRTNCGAVRC